MRQAYALTHADAVRDQASGEETHMTTTTLAPEQMVAQVEPVLRTYAPAGEAGRQLAPEAVAALIDAGMFRVWVPRAYGGLEMDPIPALKLFEEVARIDGSAGWVVSNSSLGAYMTQVLPDEGSAEMFADPRTVVAGVYHPPGAAVPVAGGYRVTGRWPFGSACHFADWLVAPCVIMDGETPRLGPDGNPLLLLVHFRRDEAEILDTWHTLGMRGTGSADFRATDVFVPERRGFVLGPLDHPGRAYAGPLYRLGTWIDPSRIAITALGVARAALDAFMDLAVAKTPTLMQTALADRSSVQDGVARARALIDAGRSYIHTTVSDAWQFVQGGPRITVAEGVPLGLAGSFGMRAAVQAVDLVYDMAGSTAFRQEHPLQQYFRDVHTLSQHAITSAARFESLGKVMLGRQSDWALYYV
jgi:alkylation response protein AidB-like acyl-CoA dehydrogenase